jgi:Transglycosylase SLT domain/D-alanyl-D-alanine carboxypeptidase/Putative Flp pilus-assembly TadE/G-like
MARREHSALDGRSESGQSTILVLGIIAALLLGALVLTAFGQAMGAKGRHQRAADLAAMSAARSMREDHPRLFEPAMLQNGVRNPRHLSTEAYLARARGAAVRGARRNGVRIAQGEVTFPGGSFAPTRVAVRVSGVAKVRVESAGRRPARPIAVRARAVAELSPPAGDGLEAYGSGGGYDGPLAYRQGKPMRPDVARAFDRMAVAARRDGILLLVNSGFRSDAEQARLFAANPNPKWVAPPGRSLHRLGTELDLGPPAAYGWLAANAGRFNFIQRYSWEPWHYGYRLNPGSSSVGFGADGRGALPSFVPPQFERPIARAAQRFNVSGALLAAQLYAESNFNPFAVSPAGARGIAQFMPGTGRSYGLRDPFDAVASIEAQARLMRDLLRQFASVPLALAAYNAGAGAVAHCGCIPPFPETRAYVTKILGLLSGAGEATRPSFEIRLVE